MNVWEPRKEKKKHWTNLLFFSLHLLSIWFSEGATDFGPLVTPPWGIMVVTESGAGALGQNNQTHVLNSCVTPPPPSRPSRRGSAAWLAQLTRGPGHVPTDAGPQHASAERDRLAPDSLAAATQSSFCSFVSWEEDDLHHCNVGQPPGHPWRLPLGSTDAGGRHSLGSHRPSPQFGLLYLLMVKEVSSLLESWNGLWLFSLLSLTSSGWVRAGSLGTELSGTAYISLEVHCFPKGHAAIILPGWLLTFPPCLFCPFFIKQNQHHVYWFIFLAHKWDHSVSLILNPTTTNIWIQVPLQPRPQITFSIPIVHFISLNLCSKFKNVELCNCIVLLQVVKTVAVISPLPFLTFRPYIFHNL